MARYFGGLLVDVLGCQPLAYVRAVDDPNRRVFDPPRLVWVTVGDTAWPGTLSEWARWDDRGWLGLCTWSTAPGVRFLRWVPAGRITER